MGDDTCKRCADFAHTTCNMSSTHLYSGSSGYNNCRANCKGQHSGNRNTNEQDLTIILIVTGVAVLGAMYNARISLS